MLEKVEEPAVAGEPGRRGPVLPTASVLPISVIIPTRNSAALLPEHLAAMRPWVDLVREVIVVDSRSTDGTTELLREGLRHPRLRFLEHPPGLYQSWNFGIRHAASEACYISTVGETITAEGLKHLSELLVDMRCDAVVSKPEFVDPEGGILEPPEWPIDDILTTLRPRDPIVLEGLSLFFFALLNYRNAILGSSASNLYRTRTLQKHPFPLNYGTVGDAAWGLQNCFKVRVAVTPRRCSTFCEHPKSYALSEYAVDRLGPKLLALVERTYRRHLKDNPDFRAAAMDLEIERILGLLRQQQEAQERLETVRAHFWPWVLSPTAWKARMRRNGFKRQIERLKSARVPCLAIAPNLLRQQSQAA